jgi:branched-chain amino acid transport system substrate-binding protein
MERRTRLAGIAVFVIAFVHAEASAAQVVKIGGICDRTGSTRIIGMELCPGVADYVALVNRQGGVLGHKLQYTEHEHAYMVPRAIDAYEKLKQEGVVVVMNYGVPILYGLTPRYTRDRIPAFNTGTGRSDAIDGETWPYIFPGTASYWSQAGAVLKFLKDNGARKGTKIAFLYLDSPAGREAMPMLEAVAGKEGYLLRAYPVQPPGLEMEAQVRDIARSFGADWAICSLFGRPPSISIKEFKAAGFPLARVISLVYGAGEADVEAAGWENAQGYLGLQYASVGVDYPIIRQIIAMYRDEGRELPAHVGHAYYNRGVLIAAEIVEGIRRAIANEGLPLTGDKVRRGLEGIKGFDAQGLGPPLELTPKDHEGGGYLRIYQVRGRDWVPLTDWIRGYHDEVMALVLQANHR